MENLLENKVVLRKLLQQGDILNTISGGVSETYMDVQENTGSLVIRVFAAKTPGKDFKVLLQKNRLTILRFLDIDEEKDPSAPVFARWFDLPLTVNKSKIEAVYEEGLLKVILPLQIEEDPNREIKIQDN